MTTISTEDGLSLEARWDLANGDFAGVVVFCHPHPLDGGTMTAPLMEAVAGELSNAGFHVLRFNFRGVGASDGSWGEGVGEVHDVTAAMRTAEDAHPGSPVGVCGWSFGASTSLRWQVETGSRHPWVGIAPGIRSYRGSEVVDPAGLEPAARLIVLGDRDQFASADDMKEFAGRAGARLEMLPGSDHFFYFREHVVAEYAIDHFRSALDVSQEG